MDIYKRISPICWYARIFGLCPFYVKRGSKFSWLSISAFWAFIVFPGFLFYLSTWRKCALFDFLFLIIPMYASNFVSTGLPELIQKISSCNRSVGNGLVWLLPAASAFFIQVLLYAFGILKSDFVTFFWYLVFSSTMRINVLLYLLFAYEIYKSFRSFEKNLKKSRGVKNVCSETLENYRISLFNILSCLNHFQKHYEPIVVLIFSVVGSRLLINIFLLLWNYRLVNWTELSAVSPFVLFISLASHFTNYIFLAINDIAHFLMSSALHKNNDLARKQVVYFVRMMNDYPIDNYVIISNVFISAFIGILTTYLIVVVQLLPELEAVVNRRFNDCIS